MIIELKKVPKIELIIIKFMRSIHMKNKIIIIIIGENLKPYKKFKFKLYIYI
jgi:hypothetical protein